MGTAIWKQGAYKALGLDGIWFIALKEVRSEVKDLITEVYQLALNQDYYPVMWKKGIGAIIPKSGKTDYSRAKAHRPISLLNTLGKGLERLCTDRLAKIGEQEELSSYQWRGMG